MTAPLLVELFTEELPPRALQALGEAFAGGITAGLAKRGLAAEGGSVRAFATPRRLAALVPEVLAKAPDTPRRDKVLPVNVALDAAGHPTPTLAKKLAALGASGVGLEQLERAPDGKQESLFWNHVAPGMMLAQGLQEALADTVAALPIPKVMRYQSADGEDVNFVRPAHGLVALHGAEVVPVRVLGLAAGRRTHGHRFMGTPAFGLGHAEGYERQLREDGMVIASFEARRAMIAKALAEAAALHQAALAEAADLLDEVTALVEFPAVYAGSFDSAFLAVPQECLILSMKRHQKYFPLVDASGRLLPRFLIVSNLRADDPRNIVHGNERVLRARLADARFFFDQDRRQRLETRVEKLGAVVYHNKLGSQLERVRRLARLAGEIARLLHADADLAERAARLAKADLVTDMVGEFPELQGIMGMHYARHDGEDDTVAAAIEAHYHPRFAADSLPADNIGAAVALADKLDTLTGIYGIGFAPSGDKDPFGLRRAALGVLRILAERELPLDLLHLLRLARAGFSTDAVSDSVASDLHGFMLERLRGLLRERGFDAAVIDAVISQRPVRIDRVVPRAEAVRAFLALPEAASLAAANKRIRNILRKSAGTPGDPDPALVQEPAEKALLVTITALAPQVASLVDNEDYTEALKRLAAVRQDVDRFFDEVMVMAEDESTRRNRLGLLARLDVLMNAVADISRLAA